ncbi:MAG: VWA domain-containing protein [Chloroflexota bacterium]
MSFLAPLATLFALLAIPIILLYMLRLRRREQVVSSNFLWQQILQDREANTPWQRLRRNILLILQLIILALIVLALMRPAQVVPTITSGKTVILLDASASMNATDVNGNTRFAEAQEQALVLLGNLTADATSDDQISVIRVAETADPLTPYTTDFQSVRQAVLNAEVGQGAGDWSTALTLAAAGSQGASNFNIIIITDGGISDSGQLPENIPAPIIIPVGESNANIAITALATRTLPGQAPQLFAQVRNYSDVPVEIALNIRLDGELWDSISPDISALSARSFVFEVDEPFATIEAELVLDDSVTDFLASDNNAFTVASDASTRRVLFLSNQQNVFLEEVLRSLPNVQIFRGDASSTALPSTPYDLYVFNDYLPDELPDADMLIVNPPRSSELFTLLAETDDTRNISVINRGHPLAAFLSLDSMNLRAFRPVSNVDWATPIATSEGGAFIYAGEDRGRQIALLPFNLLDSDLPLQIAFPILMSNLIEWVAPATIISGGTAFSVGDVVRINPPLEATSVRITLPDGATRDLNITGDTIVFSETVQTGFYIVDILQDETVSTAQVLAVNLFGTGESDIAPRTGTEIALGGGILVEDAEEQRGFREFWQLLAWLAVLVLLYEWYVYYARLRVPADLETGVRRSTARR